MRKMLRTEFSQNKTIQTSFCCSVILELLSTQSIHRMVILFALPYITSIGLKYFFKRPTNKKVPVRISNQFKPRTSNESMH